MRALAPLAPHEFEAAMAALGPFEPAPLLAVAVSGGPDSMALAKLAADWADDRGGRAHALIVDHRLRPAAAAEAEAAAAALAVIGVEASVLRVEATPPARGLPAWARAERYRLLEGWAAAHGALHLLLAHHRDDQAETVLLNLSRGSGAKGLAAMRPARAGARSRRLRPLLGVAKGRLGATAAAAGLPAADDPTNRDVAYARTRVRRALGSGGDSARLAATAARLAADDAAIEAAVTALAAAAARISPLGVYSLDLAALRAAPSAVSARLLARAAHGAGGRDRPPRGRRAVRPSVRSPARGSSFATAGLISGASRESGRRRPRRRPNCGPARYGTGGSGFGRMARRRPRRKWGRSDMRASGSPRPRRPPAPGSAPRPARRWPRCRRFGSETAPSSCRPSPSAPMTVDSKRRRWIGCGSALGSGPGGRWRPKQLVNPRSRLISLHGRLAGRRTTDRRTKVNGVSKNMLIWAAIFLALVLLFQAFQGGNMQANAQKLKYSDFVIQVENGRVQEAVIQGDTVTGRLADGSSFQTHTPNDPQLVQRLIDAGVNVTAAPEEENRLISVLISWFPMLLLIGVWIYFMRHMQSGGGRAMGFGKSKARLLTEKSGRVTFEDVAGIEEAKGELSEIVEFLRDPQKFQRLGGKIPKGCLLVGPPGTGKTLLARAIAGEANVPFFTISGSDFVEMFVGVGASRVRDMFEQGKKNAPCIIFIDEIDAVGRHRGAGLGGGNDEREQTLNQLLVEMDGFEANEGVILIAATNRPDVLDPALLRPGRFDRQVVVPNPDIRGREQILKVHMRKVPLSVDVDARVIARGTPGFSGADLANLVNEAALLAARRNKRTVTMLEMEDAKDKVMMGAERRSMVMSDDEKKLTAYHEAGHAVVMLHAKGHEPLHKVTIIPRGRALGLAMYLPERDRLSQSITEIRALIASAFGGRVAEEMVFGAENITTGAAQDIKVATQYARRLVTEFGFSDKLGPLRYADNEEEVFLGHSVTQRKNVSDATAALIDEETRRFVEEGEAEATRILTEHRDELEAIAQGLLEHETLDRADIDALLRGESIERPEPPEPPPGAPTDGGPRSSIPTGKRRRPDTDPGGAPEPQPGG